LAEIERRQQAYLGGRPRLEVAGRVAILVDDGIATGMTMCVASRAIAAHGPRQLVVAVPVAAADVVAGLRREVDDVVCLEEQEHLLAIGYHYADFAQVSDDDMREMLGQHTPVAA
jgi:predicted phosphoribosyltransferase